MQNILRLLQLFLPWISIVFLPRKSFNKFLPVSVLAVVLVTGMCSLAVPYRWWTVNGGVRNKVLNDGSFILGPFVVGTLWIFHWTYGKLGRYILLNTVFDGMFSFVLSYLYEKLGLFKLHHFKRKDIFFTFTAFSLFIYGFQKLLSSK